MKRTPATPADNLSPIGGAVSIRFICRASRLVPMKVVPVMVPLEEGDDLIEGLASAAAAERAILLRPITPASGDGVDEAQDWLRASTRNLIAAIIQYVGNMPELSEWRNAPQVAPARARLTRFSALRWSTRLVETR
jgi:hypothetical protein